MLWPDDDRRWRGPPERAAKVTTRPRARSREGTEAPAPSSRTRHLLVYDGECGFCRAAVAWMLERDREHRLRARPLQDPAALHSARVPASLARRQVVLASPSGRSRTGADAVAGVLRLLPGWRPVGRLLELPVLRTLARIVYRWIARHRSLLSRLVRPRRG